MVSVNRHLELPDARQAHVMLSVFCTSYPETSTCGTYAFITSDICRPAGCNTLWEFDLLSECFAVYFFTTDSACL